MASRVCRQASGSTQLITTEVSRAGINQRPRHWRKSERVTMILGVKKKPEETQACSVL